MVLSLTKAVYLEVKAVVCDDAEALLSVCLCSCCASNLIVAPVRSSFDLA